MLNNNEISRFTANKIKIKTNYDIELDLFNMHLPNTYELLITDLVNIYPRSNNTTKLIGDYSFTNNKYTIMFLQLGYTGINYTLCNNNNNQKIVNVQPIQIPYNELTTRNPSLRNPLQFYNAQGLLQDYTSNTNKNLPSITAANNRLQYITYTKVDFLNNKNDQLPSYIYDNRLYNNEIKFYFTIGGPYFTPNLYSDINNPPVYIDNDNNKQYYVFNEIALVAIKDTLIQNNFNNLLTASNINTSNFIIYAYRFLDIPLLIGDDKIVEIEWSIISYLK